MARSGVPPSFAPCVSVGTGLWMQAAMAELLGRRKFGNDAVIVGAHPAELYRRWIERSFEARADAGRGSA